MFQFVLQNAELHGLLHEVLATELDIQRAIEAERVFADIAYIASIPAGVAIWYYNFSTFIGKQGLHLEDLFVHPSYRRVGVAKALIQHLSEKCLAEELVRFDWMVSEMNRPAEAFYRSIGSTPMEEWRAWRLDHGNMSTPLRPGEPHGNDSLVGHDLSVAGD